MITPAGKIVKHLINKMFEYAQLPQTYDDIKDCKDEWYKEYTMTKEQSHSFKNYAIRYLKKEFKVNYHQAELEYQFFDLMWGLKISDDNSISFEDLEE